LAGRNGNGCPGPVLTPRLVAALDFAKKKIGVACKPQKQVDFSGIKR